MRNARGRRARTGCTKAYNDKLAKLYVTFESSILAVQRGDGANVASSKSNTTLARFLLHLIVTNLIVMLMSIESKVMVS